MTGDTDISGKVRLHSTSSLKIPAGTETDRGSSLEHGEIRYNTEKKTFEGYTENGWIRFGPDVYRTDITDYGGSLHWLNVVTDTSIGGNLDIVGEINAPSINLASADIIDINVSGSAEIQSLDVLDLAEMSNLNVRNKAIIKSLEVSDEIDVKTLDIKGDAKISGNIIGNTLDITGTTNITGPTKIDNTFDVAKNVSLNSTLEVSGQTNIKNKLKVTGDTTITGSLDVSSNITVGSIVEITPSSSLSDTGSSGQLRFNSDSQKFEGYADGNWAPLGQGDNDTSALTGDSLDIAEATIDALSVSGYAAIQTLDVANNVTVGDTLTITPGEGGNTGETGQVRYNSTVDQFEGYSDTNWNPMGYDFFKKNMGGQPPGIEASKTPEVDGEKAFFFSLIKVENTPSYIKLTWKNPPQYPSGITAKPRTPRNKTSAIVTESTEDVGGLIYFPVVNRTMIQIYNNENEKYERWGENNDTDLSYDDTLYSSITSEAPSRAGVTGLEYGRIICEKASPIPGPTTPAREEVYTLDNFANSIILYKENSTPLDIPTIPGDLISEKTVSPIFTNNVDNKKKELSASEQGYNIKLWLENEYDSSKLSTSYLMTKNDFNVIELNDVNFKIVGPPHAPQSVDILTKFHNISGASVSSADTYVEIKVKDPSLITTDETNYNDSVNMTHIKFEYRNDSTKQLGDWSSINNVLQIHANGTTEITEITSDTTFTDIDLATGAYSDIRKVDDSIRYYYVKLNAAMLGVDNNNLKQYLSFRVSYKNSSNSAFGQVKYSNELEFLQPGQPRITDVLMNTSTQLQFKTNLADASINSSTNGLSRTGVFLRQIKLIVYYNIDDGVDTSYTFSPTGTSSSLSGYINSVDDDDSNQFYQYYQSDNSVAQTFTFDIPSGITATNSLQWSFQVKVKNNLINNWSDISESVDNSKLTIGKPDNTNKIKNIYFNTSGTPPINNLVLNLEWDHPDRGDRGVNTVDLTSTSSADTAPTIYEYDGTITIGLLRLPHTTYDINRTSTIDFTINPTDHEIALGTVDASNSKEDCDIKDIFTSFININDYLMGFIRLEIFQRNKYITESTKISVENIYYIIGTPNPPKNRVISHNISNTTNNTLNIKWDNETVHTGFFIRQLKNFILEPVAAFGDGHSAESGEAKPDKSSILPITKYTIVITSSVYHESREHERTKSEYYKYKVLHPPSPTSTVRKKIKIEITKPYGNPHTYLDKAHDDGTIHKNSDFNNDDHGTTLTTDSDSVEDVLVFPETKYTITFSMHNIFNRTNSDSKSITTGKPPSVKSNFTGGDLGANPIPVPSDGGDIKNFNNYINKGFLLDSSPNTSPTDDTKLYQITKATGFPNLTSSKKTHLINYVNGTTKNDLNMIHEMYNGYVDEADKLNNLRLRQFKIYNISTSTTSNEIYKFGNNSNFTTESPDIVGSPSTLKQALRNMVSIVSSDVKDVYSVSGRDTHNKGYWWQEDINYTIDISDNAHLYKNPVKLIFEARYNNQLTDFTSLDESSLERDDHVDKSEQVIFKNELNSNDVIYFDNLTGAPTAAKINDSTDMITSYITTNKINGVPNLYGITGGTYTITLNYRLNNYSKYYGLDPTKHFVEHEFYKSDDKKITEIEPRNWTNKGSECERFAPPVGNGYWNVKDLTITQTSTGTMSSSWNGDTAEILTLRLKMQNTADDKNFDIDENFSTLHKFIHDYPSVNVYNSIKDSMQKVTSNFDPEYLKDFAQDEYTAETYDPADNNLQLSLWNGYFIGSAGWRNETSITSGTATQYGMSDTHPVFTNDSNYKWVIFKYTLTPADNFEYYVIVAQFEYSSFNYTNDIIDENIVVYFYNRDITTRGSDGKYYYWVGISSPSGFGETNASSGGITTYTGTLGIRLSTDSSATDHHSKFENSDYQILGVTGKRIVTSWLNKTTIPKDTLATFYIAVGIKNNKTIKVKKPTIRLGKLLYGKLFNEAVLS